MSKKVTPEIKLKPCPMCHGTKLFFNTECCECDEIHYVFLGCKGCPIVFGHTEIPHDDDDDYEKYLERAKRRIAVKWNTRPNMSLLEAAEDAYEGWRKGDDVVTPMQALKAVIEREKKNKKKLHAV